MVPSYVPREHSPWQDRRPVLLAVLDLIPQHRHPVAHSVQPDISPPPVPRVLFVKLAALPLRRDRPAVKNVRQAISLVLERLAVVCAMPYS